MMPDIHYQTIVPRAVRSAMCFVEDDEDTCVRLTEYRVLPVRVSCPLPAPPCRRRCSSSDSGSSSSSDSSSSNSSSSSSNSSSSSSDSDSDSESSKSKSSYHHRRHHRRYHHRHRHHHDQVVVCPPPPPRRSCSPRCSYTTVTRTMTRTTEESLVPFWSRKSPRLIESRECGPHRFVECFEPDECRSRRRRPLERECDDDLVYICGR
ncbi:uncharacterized protein LDX57_005519 [Aspergillus melleus]|uniref:uncharacterized protein n=1 Tax=Aspergillus melleus TaxID=138277 RepID=UPI001E8C9E1E|nr:uncharacterized protein LDX57_005519 [Aspergillus melleus]KAH8427814.1 hypothetical protein LDX57_005519 [Aspergillus melleus]